MPKYIVKLQDGNKSYYLEWSTVVDAPVTYGMSLEEFKEYYKQEYGRSSMCDLESRLKRVESKGTSSLNQTLEELILSNAHSYDLEQLIDEYCRNVPHDQENT